MYSQNKAMFLTTKFNIKTNGNHSHGYVCIPCFDVTCNSFYEMIGKNAYLIFKINIYYFNYRETTCSLARKFLCHVFEAKNEDQVLE